MRPPAQKPIAHSSLAGAKPLERPSLLAPFQRFPNLELHKIGGTGHFLMMEKPAEFNRLLKSFLDRQKY